jgi:dipeptidyl aminopeptidase/acylaminoacyl peptidase
LGYRFDFENKKLTQTGGFFLKAEPKQVEIYIEGKLAKKTDFFFGSALVENLLPKKYKIEVKKEGYLTWEKRLEIREKEVTEVKNLVLFPKNLNFDILIPHKKNGEEIENFWFSPDGKKIILMETTPPPPEKEGWLLKLYDLEKKIKSHLISEREIYQNGADFLNLDFSEDSKEIYLKVAKKEKEKTFILKLDKLPPQLVEKEITPPPENILASKKQFQDVYYLDKAGYVFKNGIKLNEIPFPVQWPNSPKQDKMEGEVKSQQPETKYTLKIFQDFLFLIEENLPFTSQKQDSVAKGKNLYLFSPDSKSFEKFFEKVKDLKISPDNKKLAFFSDSEIWILFLKEEGAKKAGEKLFLVRLSEKIDDLFWLNSDYLIFNSGDNLKIVEIDDRDRIQTWDILPNFSKKSLKFYFNESDRKLYLLTEENLLVSEKLF